MREYRGKRGEVDTIHDKKLLQLCFLFPEIPFVTCCYFAGNKRKRADVKKRSLNE
jgi:hypothetical protein